MTRTMKRVLIGVVALFVAWYLSIVLLSINAQARPLSTTGFCTEYPNGVLAGWFGMVRKHDGIPATTSWRFGGNYDDPIPWGGTFCSNHHRVWNVNWGGEPAGYAVLLYTWRYFPSDTRLVVKDNEGTYRSHVWQAHFESGIFMVGNACYPRLGVTLGPDQYIKHIAVTNCSQ